MSCPPPTQHMLSSKLLQQRMATHLWHWQQLASSHFEAVVNVLTPASLGEAQVKGDRGVNNCQVGGDSPGQHL
jgi:hypothetical protein